MRRNAIVLFMGTIAVLALFLPPYGQWQKKTQRNAQFVAQIENLKAEQKALVEEKRLLEEDPAYIEKIARDKMGLIKEGEVVYKFRLIDPPLDE